jgi:hypothetical protein
MARGSAVPAEIVENHDARAGHTNKRARALVLVLKYAGGASIDEMPVA